MKNHYVSQFIIKKFSNTISIFDINTGKIDASKRPAKVFYKDDIFTEEIETLMCNTESRVANILNDKILVNGEVKLTREELFTLKRYMLICSIRTMDEDSFEKTFKKFRHNTDMCIMYLSYDFPFLASLPYNDDLNISNHDLYLRTLKVFSDNKMISKALLIRDIIRIMDVPEVRKALVPMVKQLFYVNGEFSLLSNPKTLEYLSNCFINMVNGEDYLKIAYDDVLEATKRNEELLLKYEKGELIC